MCPLDDHPAIGDAHFATTQWSVVLAAGGTSSEGRLALEALCVRYWYPLYAYVRRRLGNREQAEDLTQEFFARLLEKNLLARATPDAGRFRSFLLTALKNFLTNEWHRQQAAKRGGGQKVQSLDIDSGESRYVLQPSHDITPEKLFDRQWAHTLLELVLTRLRNEFATAGKLPQFERLKEFLVGQSAEHSYSGAGEDLEMTDVAVRQAVHRMRKRYRELLRTEIGQTVAEPADVEAEIRSLFASYSA
jgi:RNA polymerase sigma factor (sigma-70 family)